MPCMRDQKVQYWDACCEVQIRLIVAHMGSMPIAPQFVEAGLVIAAPNRGARAPTGHR